MEKDFYGRDTSGEFSVTLKGFKSEEDAANFISWFCGSGEQDLFYWCEDKLYTYTTSSIKIEKIDKNLTKILVAHPIEKLEEE